MKICHIISSIDKNSGGTSTYLQSLVNELGGNCSITVATIKSPKPLQLNKKSEVYFSDKSIFNIGNYSLDFKKYLWKIETDIFHGNGIWHYPTHIMCGIA